MMTLRGIKSQRKPHRILEEIRFEILYRIYLCNVCVESVNEAMKCEYLDIFFLKIICYLFIQIFYAK